jgi:hypothetical protein
MTKRGARIFWLRLVVLLVSCLPTGCIRHTATELWCADIAGTYNVDWSDSCGNTITLKWTLLQDGCTFHTPLFPDVGIVSGSITGDMVTITITSGFIACHYSLVGAARFENGTLTGSASGSNSGPGCCNPLTVHFSATRQQ